jgi:hypothetical protein
VPNSFLVQMELLAESVSQNKLSANKKKFFNNQKE